MPLDDEGEQCIRQVVGSLLWYARVVDPTFLFALSTIAQEQANPTDKTMQHVKQRLDYMHSNPMAKIQFQALDMILNIHSDASYLSPGKGRSRAGGYFSLEACLATANLSGSMETFTLRVLS